MVMFLSRITFFRLYESPRYLVHAGRPQEAIVSLQKISEFNGEEMDLNLEDVEDKPVDTTPASPDALVPPRGSINRFDAPNGERPMNYQALRKPSISEENEDTMNSESWQTSPVPRRTISHSRASSRSQLKGQGGLGNVPRWIRKPLNAWFKRLGILMTTEWRNTTILVWIVWWSMSLGISNGSVLMVTSQMQTFKLLRCLMSIYQSF
jgi:hypothetical protein